MAIVKIVGENNEDTSPHGYITGYDQRRALKRAESNIKKHPGKTGVLRII